jgi:hypothetical protein
MTLLLLAAIDGLVGAWLIRYAVTREQRDKSAVFVTGIFLLVCAAVLLLLGLLTAETPSESISQARTGHSLPTFSVHRL